MFEIEHIKISFVNFLFDIFDDNYRVIYKDNFYMFDTELTLIQLLITLAFLFCCKTSISPIQGALVSNNSALKFM